MRKSIGIAIILLLISGVSTAFACSGKGTSANAAKTDRAAVSSQSCSVGAMPKSSEIKANGVTKTATPESSNSCSADSKRADFKTASNSSGCFSEASPKSEKKSAGITGSSAMCPAAASSTSSGLNDEAKTEDSRTQTEKAEISEGMVSIYVRPQP